MAARLILILSFLLLSLAVQAKVSGFAIDTTRVSGTGLDPADTTKEIIYAGFTGDVGGCATSQRVTTSVCDSCTALDLSSGSSVKACSNRSIFGNLILSFNIAFDSVPANQNEIKVFLDSNPVTLVTSLTGVVAGTTYNVQMTWDSICAASGSTGTTGSNCSVGTESFSKSLKIGLKTASGTTDVDTNNAKTYTLKFRAVDPADSDVAFFVDSTCTANMTGFCDYSVFPGDSKVYLEQPFAGGIGPNSLIRWSAMRVYYATGAIPAINANSSYQDLSVTNKDKVTTPEDMQLSPNYVDGLTNDQRYQFLIASVDETGIIQQFYDPDTYLDAGTEINKHTATPGEVVGLLKNKKCFIATAAYGSPMDSRVEMLRQFRNKYLLTSFLGRQFVKFYYRYSPPLAHFISEHESLRAFSRAILWPVVTTVEWIMNGSQN